LADHRETADKLGLIVNEAFAFAGYHLAEEINEFDVAEFIRDRFADQGIASPDGPMPPTRTMNPRPTGTAPSNKATGC